MESNKKAVLLIGLVQYASELIEDLIDDKYLSSVFTFGLKKSSKDFIRYSDRIITAVTEGRDKEVVEEVYNIYRVVVNKLEEIDWYDEKKNLDNKREESVKKVD